MGIAQRAFKTQRLQKTNTPKQLTRLMSCSRYAASCSSALHSLTVCRTAVRAGRDHASGEGGRSPARSRETDHGMTIVLSWSFAAAAPLSFGLRLSSRLRHWSFAVCVICPRRRNVCTRSRRPLRLAGLRSTQHFSSGIPLRHVRSACPPWTPDMAWPVLDWCWTPPSRNAALEVSLIGGTEPDDEVSPPRREETVSEIEVAADDRTLFSVGPKSA